MLSSDNYTHGGSQGYNRYTYAMNNPLKYTDPDGQNPLLGAAIGAAVFATGNLIAHAIRGDVKTFGDGAKYFVQGALSGAVVGLGIGAALSVPVLGPILKGIGTVQAGLTATSLVGGAITHGWNGVANAGKILAGRFYLDENKHFFSGVWEGISRNTWQILQSEIGYTSAQFSNTLGKVKKVDYFGGATFSRTFWPGGSITLGHNIFLKDTQKETAMTIGRGGYTFMHEYGHYRQSQKSGLAYLFMYGIPSASDATWTEQDANFRAANYFHKVKPSFTWDTNRYSVGNPEHKYSGFNPCLCEKNPLWYDILFFPIAWIWNTDKFKLN